MTQNDKIFKTLDRIGNFDAREKKLIAKHARLVNIPKDWAPIAQSTLSDKVYLIVEGEASVQKDRREIAVLASGDLMGEMGVSRRRPRNATVVAKTPMTVAHFTREDWALACSQVPLLAQSVENIIETRANKI